MKDVSATLRRIDEEITGHKQRIAFSQVEIMRLQDTRQVLARLVEDDQHAEQQAKMEQARVIPGAHAKPVLIVRREAALEESPPVKKSKRDYKVDSAKYGKRSKPSESGDYRKKIRDTLAPDENMTSREIGDYLGLPRDEAARKAMSNALYQMRVKGDIVRDDHSRYSLAKATPP